MSIFSIKDIEALSGIMSHTLRIWEQRYGIIRPKRTETNIRYYDDEDLKHILNISMLNRSGHKISKIAKMTRDEIHDQVVKISSSGPTNDSQIRSLVAAMMAFDEQSFHHVLTTIMIQEGMESAMLDIVFPFLKEVGVLWQIGSIQPAHEHFVSNIIKQKLFVAIDGKMGRYATDKKRFLLFLPEHEQHSIGILFANYLIRSRGHEVIYLGQQVPLDDLKYSATDFKPDYIFTLLTSATHPFNKSQFVRELSGIWPQAQVMISGAQLMILDFELPSNVTLYRSLGEFITFFSAPDPGQLKA